MIKEYFERKRELKRVQKEKELEMQGKIDKISKININDELEKERRKREIVECTLLMTKLDSVINEDMSMSQLNKINDMLKKYFHNYKLIPSIESKDCYEALFKLNMKIDLIIIEKINYNMENNIFDIEDMNYIIKYGNIKQVIKYRDFLLDNIVTLNFNIDVETMVGILDKKLESKTKNNRKIY